MNICCICETNKYSGQFRIVNGYNLLKCSKCGLVYLTTKTNPLRFVADAKEDLSFKRKSTEYWSFPSIYEKYFFVFDKFFKERLDRCRRYKKDISSMFDIGCGYGFWMDYCRCANIKVKGIDIFEEAVNYCKEKFGLEAEISSLAEFNFNKKHDLYNFCDVLEHLDNPNRELKIIYNAMKPDSLLYIQVPDVLGIKIPFGHNLGLPHHIWQFNFKTLKKLLHKNGFFVLEKWHGIQGVIGSYVHSRVNSLTKLKWAFAKKINLGNRLAVICKKI